MTNPSAYPRPVPLSQDDAVALASSVGTWTDVPGSFLVWEMIPIIDRIGEWRFAGAAKSLAGAFECLAKFAEAFGMEPTAARENVAELLGTPVLEVHDQLEDGWSAVPDLDELETYRVIYYGEGGAPYDCFGICILEVEPDDAKAFFSRLPETHPVPTWEEYLQKEQQVNATGDAD